MSGNPWKVLRVCFCKGMFLTSQGMFPSHKGTLLTYKDMFLSRKGTLPTSKGMFLSRRGTLPTSRDMFLSRKGTFPSSKGMFLSRKGTFPTSKGMRETPPEVIVAAETGAGDRCCHAVDTNLRVSGRLCRLNATPRGRRPHRPPPSPDLNCSIWKPRQSSPIAPSPEQGRRTTRRLSYGTRL